MTKQNQRPVRITILGKEYHIVCPDEERDGLLEAARQLEKNMNQIRDSGRVFGAERIAVMAALNVTHELLQSGSNNSSEQPQDADLQERVINLQDRIDNFISSLKEER